MAGTAFRAAERLYRGVSLESAPPSLLDPRRGPLDPSVATPLPLIGLDLVAYELVAFPGVVLIPDALSMQEQRAWTAACLTRYSGSRSNLHAEYVLPMRGDSSLWALSQKDVEAVPKPGRPSATYADLMRRLRWTTLGYHYDWTAHAYTPGDEEPFPDDLADLCVRFARALGHDTYAAEAAIINFYGPKDTLSGHVDYSERDHVAPLLSFSLGNAAVFLVGGLTRDVEPAALLLRSGDCVVMRGKARLAYHGVPKIFAGTTPQELWDNPDAPDSRINDYVRINRINMNIRQVEEYNAGGQPAVRAPATIDG